MMLAILLPTGAQACISGIVGPRFLIVRGWQQLRDQWPQHPQIAKLREIFAGLWQGILLLMAAHVFLLICQLLKSWLADDSLTLTLSSYLRLLGKQGLYGSFLVLTFIVTSKRFREHGLTFLTWQARGLLLASVLLGLYMLGQRAWGWDWIHGWNAKIGEHRFAYGVYRASGVMGHPLSLAYNCMLLALASVAQGLWLWSKDRNQSTIWLAISVVNLGLIGLTGSRYPLILAAALMVLAILLAAPRHRIKWALLASVLLLLSGAVFCLLDPVMMGRISELIDTNTPIEERFDRWIFWKVHILMFVDQPWLGTGLANYDGALLDYYDQAGYTDMERKYSAHNILLQTLADSGLIGTLSLLVLFVVWFRAAFRVLNAFGHQGLLLIGLGTLFGGLMQNTLRDSEFLFALWTSMGLCCGCLIAGGVPNESNSRSHLENHQSREDFADRRPNV